MEAIKIKRKYKKRILWNQQSEQILLELWQAKMGQQRGARKNLHIMEEMAAEMQKTGFGVCASETQMKMHNLTSRYRTEKAKIGPSGESPSDWHLYAQMNALLGPYKSSNAEKMMEDSIMDDCFSSAPPSAASTEVQIGGHSRHHALHPHLARLRKK